MYQLDPAHYSSAPGLTWEAALKYSGAEISLIDDITQSLFVGKSNYCCCYLIAILTLDQAMVGGYSAAHIPYVEANNIYMPDYRAEEPNNYLLYLDANNLYGHSLSSALPQSDFRWLDQKTIREQFTAERIRNLTYEEINEADRGYFVEVDLFYPESLHDKHNTLPCGPMMSTVTADMLSEEQRRNAEKLGIKIGKGSQKILLDFREKKGFVTHLQNLALYLKLGVELKKVSRVLSFRQADYFRSYIELNTELRRAAGTDVTLKDFAKLMVSEVILF